MLDKNAKTEQEKEILENMQISTDRIINIVNSMRNQIRNLGSNDKEKFSLNQMVADLHVITQNEQKKNGCTFESDVKEEIEIYGERTKLGQVLTNIVVNSIQAYGGNGKKGNVKLTAFKKDINTCRIEIADQAGGIPEKVQKYLFKNIMTTKGAKGTGLGLYLAGSVIKGIYQGNIWFEVEKNVGTTFIIEIPMNMEG
jgi:signal transduction histidine kinase